MPSGLSLQQKDNRIVAGLLTLNTFVRSVVALRPIEYLDGLVIPDDAYLSLTTARNIARGLGPLYSLEHTNGFQPLYVFLMVPRFRLLVGAYTCYIFTSWFYERYLFPIGIVVFLLMGIALDRFFLHYSSHRTGVRWAGTLAVVLVGLNIMQPTFRDLITSTDTQTRGYMNVGLWARREFPGGTILGAQQSGAIGYFADNLRVINLDGVVNASCYRSLVERRNIDYIRATRIQHIVGWKVDLSFIKSHSTNYADDDLQLVKELDGFTSWNQPWYLFKVNLRH